MCGAWPEAEAIVGGPAAIGTPRSYSSSPQLLTSPILCSATSPVSDAPHSPQACLSFAVQLGPGGVRACGLGRKQGRRPVPTSPPSRLPTRPGRPAARLPSSLAGAPGRQQARSRRRNLPEGGRCLLFKKRSAAGLGVPPWTPDGPSPIQRAWDPRPCPSLAHTQSGEGSSRLCTVGTEGVSLQPSLSWGLRGLGSKQTLS